jgi:hypothetical protein
MKTILIAALLLAAPAFARDRDDDDEYNQYNYNDDQQIRQPRDNDQQYGQRQDYAQPQEYAPPDQGPTYDDFRNDSELSWNGEWIDTPEYGTVWRPNRVSDSWQPYLYGRWAMTNAGWAWVSDEPFGWAVYHYGRWAWSPMGWMWIPGRVWAPAWVSWRWVDGYAGWCPLGPRSYVYQQPAQWVFVRKQHFLEPVRSNVVPRPLVAGLPAPSTRGPQAGPPIRMIEQATGRTVRPLAITDVPVPHAAHASQGSVGFYRPRTAPIAPIAAPRPAPQRPVYFGGAPAPRQGVPQSAPAPRQGGPQSAPAPRAVAPHAAPPANTGQSEHAKER